LVLGDEDTRCGISRAVGGRRGIGNIGGLGLADSCSVEIGFDQGLGHVSIASIDDSEIIITINVRICLPEIGYEINSQWNKCRASSRGEKLRLYFLIRVNQAEHHSDCKRLTFNAMALENPLALVMDGAV
jgi:hypothetical protein